MKIDKASIAMPCITICACVAALLGHDGWIITIAMAAIAGLGGYEIGIHKRQE